MNCGLMFSSKTDNWETPQDENFGDGCWASHEKWFDSPEEAAAVWNRRVNDEQDSVGKSS